LRRAIFCDEQRLFKASDEDEWDSLAYPIVAAVTRPDGGEEVVGVVRIYEASPGVWYGGRLGVVRAHRRLGFVGSGLIHKAVTTAHGWGCRRFLAIVQEANVPLFEGLAWRSLESCVHLGRPHHLMQADLASYPPGNEPRVAPRAWESRQPAEEEASLCP
jgi:putative N-acetyltransferase (TIGR04045 family)